MHLASASATSRIWQRPSRRIRRRFYIHWCVVPHVRTGDGRCAQTRRVEFGSGFHLPPRHDSPADSAAADQGLVSHARLGRDGLFRDGAQRIQVRRQRIADPSGLDRHHVPLPHQARRRGRRGDHRARLGRRRAGRTRLRADFTTRYGERNDRDGGVHHRLQPAGAAGTGTLGRGSAVEYRVAPWCGHWQPTLPRAPIS